MIGQKKIKFFSVCAAQVFQNVFLLDVKEDENVGFFTSFTARKVFTISIH